MTKDIDPSDIGKHPSVIKKAQLEMTQMDVLVCGKCHSVFHFIDLFKEHQENECKLESSFKECRETKPKVWAFLLWKASQLNAEDNANVNSWKLYQTWVKLDETVRETWVVAGRTIQSFARMGQGSLQEMPVKITKTVVDPGSSSDVTPESKKVGASNLGGNINRFVKKAVETRPVQRITKKEDTENEDDPDESLTTDDDYSPIKINSQKIDLNKGKRPVGRPPKPFGQTIIVNKGFCRSAKRTMNANEIEEHTVEKILAKRYNPRRKQHEYLVKWENFTHEQNTWEPHSHLDACTVLLDNFEKQLARQKEQRAQAAKEAEEAAKQTSSVDISPSGRPLRNSKVKALDQVKQWCADEDNVKVTKRKNDDSDYDEEGDEGDDEGLPPKKLIKTDNPAVAQALIKAGQSGNVRIIQVNKATGVTTTVNPKTMNGASTGLRTIKKIITSPDVNKNSAEVVITTVKDGNKTTGIVKKPGVNISPTAKKEAQIRVVPKGEAVSSGVVRIVQNVQQQQGSGVKVMPRLVHTSAPRTAVRPGGPNITRIQQTTVTRPGTTPILRAVSRPPVSTPPQRPIITQQKQPLVRRTIGPSPNSVTPVQAKPTITRIVKSAPTSKQSTPEQKIMTLTRQGDLKVVRKYPTTTVKSTAIEQQASEAEENEEEDFGFPDEFPSDLPPPAPASPPRPLTLCPVTGKVLGQAEGEPTPLPSPDPVPEPEKKPEVVTTVQKTQPVQQPPPLQQQPQPQKQVEAKTSQVKSELITEEKKVEPSEEIAPSASLNTITSVQTEDGQIQQLLTNEDGSPLLVTGEDGTIYQVAGKNAEGQTLLIAQGADGEQQCVYVAAEDSDENSVLTLDTNMTEAVSQMMPEQGTLVEGGTQYILKQDSDQDAQQQLMITTDSDSQDGQITAELVQADLPSPGGTRRVVLMLPDGNFMMTEVNEEQYQQFNIGS